MPAEIEQPSGDPTGELEGADFTPEQIQMLLENIYGTKTNAATPTAKPLVTGALPPMPRGPLGPTPKPDRKLLLATIARNQAKANGYHRLT